MDAKEREMISGIIRDKISDLENSIAGLTSTRQLLTDQPKDNDARIEILSNAPVNETTYTQMKIEIEQLRNNLDWLWSEHGGECAECGCEIPIGRLGIVPTTRLCVDCSSKHEQGD